MPKPWQKNTYAFVENIFKTFNLPGFSHKNDFMANHATPGETREFLQVHLLPSPAETIVEYIFQASTSLLLNVHLLVPLTEIVLEYILEHVFLVDILQRKEYNSVSQSLEYREPPVLFTSISSHLGYLQLRVATMRWEKEFFAALDPGSESEPQEECWCVHPMAQPCLTESPLTQHGVTEFPARVKCRRSRDDEMCGHIQCISYVTSVCIASKWIPDSDTLIFTHRKGRCQESAVNGHEIIVDWLAYHGGYLTS